MVMSSASVRRETIVHQPRTFTEPSVALLAAQVTVASLPCFEWLRSPPAQITGLHPAAFLPCLAWAERGASARLAAARRLQNDAAAATLGLMRTGTCSVALRLRDAGRHAEAQCFTSGGGRSEMRKSTLTAAMAAGIVILASAAPSFAASAANSQNGTQNSGAATQQPAGATQTMPDAGAPGTAMPNGAGTGMESSGTAGTGTAPGAGMGGAAGTGGGTSK